MRGKYDNVPTKIFTGVYRLSIFTLIYAFISAMLLRLIDMQKHTVAHKQTHTQSHAHKQTQTKFTHT